MKVCLQPKVSWSVTSNNNQQKMKENVEIEKKSKNTVKNR